MKRELIALMLFAVLLLPMYAGIRAIRRLPGKRPDSAPPKD